MPTRSNARVRDIDRGFRRYRRSVASVAEPRLVVGITEGSGRAVHADNRATAAEVALFAEFGTRTSPPQPFLRSIDDRETAAAARVACGRVAAAGLDADARASREALDAAGAELAVATRARIERMGLVDEGVLRDAVTHEVRS